MPAVITSLKLEPDLRARVLTLAEKQRRKPHWIMLEAIRQYVEREEGRDAAWQDAMRAWKNYRSTGLHATAEEMEAWFDKLEAGTDAEPPACHR